jgi:uncharacterized protein YggE
MATVTVRGTGTAYGTPDEATLGLGIESVRGTAAEALADVAERTKALVRIEPPTPRSMRMEALASEAMPIAARELHVVATVDVEFNLEQG